MPETLNQIINLAQLMRQRLDDLGSSREVSAAKTKVDEAELWAMKACNGARTQGAA